MLFVAALMYPIRASARYTRAISSTVELLTKLRIESIFVGNVARAAWLGTEVDCGAVDVLALMNAPQRNQLAMMASNRGFRVEREELEAAVELDLVPLHHLDPEGEVRVHVLLASNALYGRMVAAGIQAEVGSAVGGRQSAVEKSDDLIQESPLSSTVDRRPPTADPIRVPHAEDLALLLLMGEDEESVQQLERLPEFDRLAFEKRLAAIGLGGRIGRA